MIDELRNIRRRVAMLEAAMAKLSSEQAYIAAGAGAEMFIPSALDANLGTATAGVMSTPSTPQERLSEAVLEARMRAGDPALLREHFHKVLTVQVALAPDDDMVAPGDAESRDGAREMLALWGHGAGRDWRAEAAAIRIRHQAETIVLASSAAIEADALARMAADPAAADQIAGEAITQLRGLGV